MSNQEPGRGGGKCAYAIKNSARAKSGALCVGTPLTLQTQGSFKRGRIVLRERVEVKYRMIARCRDAFLVRTTCRCVRASPSGDYYGWRDRPASLRKQASDCSLASGGFMRQAMEYSAARACGTRCVTWARGLPKMGSAIWLALPMQQLQARAQRCRSTRSPSLGNPSLS